MEIGLSFPHRSALLAGIMKADQETLVGADL